VIAAALATLLALAPAPVLPRPEHVVVIVEENKSFAEVIGQGSAPYINALVKQSALFTDAHGTTHPSAPNYFALFAGRTNTNGDDCPETGIPPNAPNLGSELIAAHLTFSSYSEDLPKAGYKGCEAGQYARKHAPWVMFTNVPASSELPYSALGSFDRLPTVAFIVPNADDDMHDGTVKMGDDWLVQRLKPLVDWAQTHDTLVILTWDEGFDPANSIPTLFFGPMVKPGRYSMRVSHYSILRTIEQMYGLPLSGHAADVPPITGCWR